MTSYVIVYEQAGHLPAPNPDDSRAFTKSERNLLDFQRPKRMNARDLKDLIQDVLHNPEFNAADVDHNMHARLMWAVEDGQMDILDMWQEGRRRQWPTRCLIL